MLLRSTRLPSGEATYWEAGPTSGATVVLLHGGGLDCASLSWRLLIPELAAERRIIAPNWPGYKGTTAFGGPYVIADIGNWLISFLDHLDIATASMVGVSMGGGAALWSAVHHPDRVEALIPVATYGVAQRAPYHVASFLMTMLPVNALAYAVMRRHSPTLRRAVEAIFADPARVSDEIIADVSDALTDAGNGKPFSDFQRGEMTMRRLRTVLSEALKDVAHPTLFIHGRGDTLVPIDAVKRAAASMTNARVDVMDAGHWPMRERPDAFNALVLDFLIRNTYQG